MRDGSTPELQLGPLDLADENASEPGGVSVVEAEVGTLIHYVEDKSKIRIKGGIVSGVHTSPILIEAGWVAK